ncbi:MAG: DUF433 domain-containing protein [Planctomycetaceae bacterium]
MAAAATKYKHLVRKPNSLYRQLFIKDRWIAVRTLYGLAVGDDALTPEDIAENYDLPREAIEEAIAYCRSGPPEIAQDVAAEEAAMHAMGMDNPDYRLHPRPVVLSPQEMARLNRL